MRKLLTFLIALAVSVGAAASSFGGSMTLLGVGTPPASGYTAQGVTFATNTNLDKPSHLTGVADSKTGMLSFWFKAQAGTDTTTIRILAGAGAIVVERLATSDVMRVILINAAGTNIMNIQTLSTFAVGSGWHHFLARWDLSVPSFQYYVNDVSDAGNNFGLTNDTIAYNTTANDWSFNAIGVNGAFDIADLWFEPNQTPLDFSVTANRRKFISAGLAPVNLGTNGSTPTGTPPAIFMSGAAASWNTNKGAGGGFTSSGTAITAASTNPP